MTAKLFKEIPGATKANPLDAAGFFVIFMFVWITSYFGTLLLMKAFLEIAIDKIIMALVFVVYALLLYVTVDAFDDTESKARRSS